GSGKSSLAFDTIYAEGQRRYVESLSAYARQFLEQMQKPDVDSIEGLSPAIAIEQRSVSRNPRSTVGTITEIYDYLRLLFARVGQPHCPSCGRPIASQSVQQMTDRVLGLGEGARVQVLAPVVRGRKGEYRKELDEFRRQGFVRVRVDGVLRELSEEIRLAKTARHSIEVVVDRLAVKEGARGRIAESIETATRLANGLVIVSIVQGAGGAAQRAQGQPPRSEPEASEVRLPGERSPEEWLLSERNACPDCGVSYPEIAPRMFSFNSPHGACPACDGIGTRSVFDPARVVAHPELSLASGAIRGWDKRNAYYFSLIQGLAEHYGFDVTTAFEELPEKIRRVVLYGSEGEKISFEFPGARFERRRQRYPFEGILPNLERRYRETDSEIVREELAKYLSDQPCPECGGARLNRSARNVYVGDTSLPELGRHSIAYSRQWATDLKLPGHRGEIAAPILKEIRQRLDFLGNVGLEYLSLARSAETLSGGEAQRIRLASQIGAGLVGVMYVLDEPS
ncbi:MAG: excinuclease ABC subunit UvrA, partial [Gammaproteobacteria bacterium]